MHLRYSAFTVFFHSVCIGSYMKLFHLCTSLGHYTVMSWQKHQVQPHQDESRKYICGFFFFHMSQQQNSYTMLHDSPTYDFSFTNGNWEGGTTFSSFAKLSSSSSPSTDKEVLCVRVLPCTLASVILWSSEDANM